EIIDVHRIAENSEVAVVLWQAAGDAVPRIPSVLAPPDSRCCVGTGSRLRIERNHVHPVGILRVHDNRKAEVRGQPFGAGSPRATIVVAAQYADVGTEPDAHGRKELASPTAMVLHVEATWRLGVTRDLVDALSELGIGIGHESDADPLIGCPERLAAILA